MTVLGLAAAGACTSSGGDALGPPLAAEAGIVVDGSAKSSTDASSADATPGVDARSPDEIIIQAPGASFAIDTKEITIAEYTLFRASPTVAVASIKGCEWKTSLGPAPTCATSAGGDDSRAMTCIDWCDAQAFCTAHGKRLCARVGGSIATTNADRLNPLFDEWTRACGGPLTSDRWPYGATAMPSLCNTAERDAGTTLPASSVAGCTGAPAELLDMSGNAAEWEDSCLGDGGAGDAATDTCAVRGGSFGDTVENAKCSHIAELGRAEASPTVGARCCKDLQQ
jgi:formylglycine-generating enzyme required for sulfatase activity